MNTFDVTIQLSQSIKSVNLCKYCISYYNAIDNDLQDVLPETSTQPPPVDTILTVVSYIGSSLSVIALVIALVTYLAEK